MNVVENVSKIAANVSGSAGLRTGADYLESLRDGRQIFVDGRAQSLATLPSGSRMSRRILHSPVARGRWQICSIWLRLRKTGSE